MNGGFTNDMIKKTKGSGNLHGDCDLVIMVPSKKEPGTQIAIDGKYSSNPPKDKDLEKAYRQAKHTGRDSVLLSEIVDPAKLE